MAAETAPKTGEALASWVPRPLAEQLRAQAEAAIGPAPSGLHGPRPSMRACAAAS
jgi:hypothetical protein